MLEGSISNLGNEYVLGLRATRCGPGDLLDVEQATAKTKEQVLDALTAGGKTSSGGGPVSHCERDRYTTSRWKKARLLRWKL